MAHFSDEQIRAFSRRSEQIEKGLAAMGLTRETADAQRKAASRWLRVKRKQSIPVKKFTRNGPAAPKRSALILITVNGRDTVNLWRLI
ncbi:hypothetical protein [Raoultella planticola]|uniref:Uncharacterized protein n=1 Tax=Raoultella planticola TaxID=575 RepID=A0A9Q9P0N5_RAOPL|nr:hypothetical protein [Raoultella planticola]UYA92904.1 hypothetical protein KKU17_p00040 [Raoultella planticola]